MQEKEPSKEALELLIGKDRVALWQKVCNKIEDLYSMEKQWLPGGKQWTYIYKFRKGEKTLCCFCMKKNVLGIVVILGKEERVAFEQSKKLYHEEIIQIYENTKTYHDGKWLLLELENQQWLEDIERLLRMKRKPNRR